jgi:uncharacterized membrane protein
MGVEFAAPWYVLLLVLLPLALWLARGKDSGISGARRRTSLLLRLLVLLLLVLAAAELRIVRRNEKLAVIFVVDRSESIPAEKRDLARRYVIEEAEKRNRAQEDLVGVVAFGKAAGIEWSPRPAAVELESFATLIEPEATDIGAGIGLAAAAFPDGVAKRIVVLTDGNENRGSAVDQARTARSQGVTVDVVPITYAYAAEIAVEKLLVDPEVNVGQPFGVRVVINSTEDVEALLRLFEDDKLIPQPSNRVKLSKGKNVFDFQRRFDVSGKHDFEARVEPLQPENDSILLNNSASAFTFVEGEPRVLLCTQEPELETPLIRALESEKIAVKVIAPEFLPQAIESYFEYQAVFFSNVAAHQLTSERMLLFEALVKVVGVGFVMIGGENSFGAGGYQGSPVERLLPVDMEVRQRKVLPNGALAMIVHSCELTNGNYWANQVIQKAVRILSPRDFAGVLYFDSAGQDRWLFPMTSVEKRQWMISLLDKFNPGDMPSFQTIIEMASKGLQATNAAIRHIIILTDGDPIPPTAAAVDAIRKAGITISAICYGAHGGVPPAMQQLARQGGGKFYMLQSPRNLPELFIREASTVQRSLILEESFRPVLATRGPILQGLDESSIPQLDGFVITTPKELATLHLLRPPLGKDPTQDPILASWTYGLGKAVAFTSDAGRRWGKAWASWDGYQRFWSQCARWVARRHSDDRFRIARSIDGDKGWLSIDAITPDGRFLNGLVFEGRVTTPDFESGRIAVRQVSPGRYVAEFPVSRKGTYTVALSYERGGALQSLVTGISVPYSAEYRKLSTNEELLRSIARAGGGKYYPDPTQVEFFARDFPVSKDVDSVWLSLVTLAIVLFFADVFVRRVVVDYRKAAAGLAARAAARLRGRKHVVSPAEEHLAKLLTRKAELREAARGTSLAPPGRPSAGVPPDGAVGRGGMTDAGVVLKESAKPPEPTHRSPSAPPKPAPAGDEISPTSRLLEAKRRAQRRDKPEKEGP